MSNVSFTGLASGMDTATIVAQLIELKRAPIYRLQSQQQGYENQISALGALKTKLTALQEAARALDTANEFASLTATSSNESIVTVTAGSNAAPGFYDIEVTALAEAQKSRSQGYDTALTSVGEGTLNFTVGGQLQSLELTEYTSLEDLAERINNEVDGVSAAIINDGSATGGYSLVLTGEEGTSGSFTVDASGLSGGTAPTFSELQAASDASLIVDGIVITADSNHLDDVISGVTLDLTGVSPTGVTTRVEIATDSAGVKEQVKALVDAYNDLVSYYEAESGAGGKLEGNATSRSIVSRMRNVMSASHSGGGAFSILAQIGIERQQSGGTLEFNEADFDAALADNYGAVRDLFIERDGNIGKAALIDTAVDELTDSIDGLFKIGTDSLNRRVDNVENTIERYEMSIENYRTTLERKFLAMESAVAMLQAQGSYLSSMVFPQ